MTPIKGRSLCSNGSSAKLYLGRPPVVAERSLIANGGAAPHGHKGTVKGAAIYSRVLLVAVRALHGCTRNHRSVG